MPLWNWNIVEGGVTIVCACLFESKPVVMLLVPDKLIAKVKSTGHHSLRYYRSNLVPRAASIQRKASRGSFERSEEVSPFALQGQQNRAAARYDLEKYGTPSEYVCLDDSRPISEPAQVKTNRHDNP